MKNSVLAVLAWAAFAAPSLAQSAAPKAGAAKPAAAAAATAGDAAKGQVVFTQVCSVCHKDPAGPLGPSLKGVYGRKAGSTEFKYSKGMVESGITWDDAKLDTYLQGPSKMIQGGIMAINVAKPEDRANVIAYLKTYK